MVDVILFILVGTLGIIAWETRKELHSLRADVGLKRDEVAELKSLIVNLQANIQSFSIDYRQLVNHYNKEVMGGVVCDTESGDC